MQSGSAFATKLLRATSNSGVKVGISFVVHAVIQMASLERLRRAARSSVASFCSGVISSHSAIS